MRIYAHLMPFCTEQANWKQHKAMRGGISACFARVSFINIIITFVGTYLTFVLALKVSSVTYFNTTTICVAVW